MMEDSHSVNSYFNAPCDRQFCGRFAAGSARMFSKSCPLADREAGTAPVLEALRTERGALGAPPPAPPFEPRGIPEKAGPAAGRERDCCAVIPFASGTAVNLLTGANGSRSTVGLIGFGAGTGYTAPVDPINISTLGSDAVNMAFSMPDGGVITAMSAYFSLTLPGLPEIDNIITAQLYISTFPNDSFMPVTAARIRLGTVRGGDPAGLILHGGLTGLSVSLPPETRLLMVFSSRTAQGVASAVAGFMSAGIKISQMVPSRDEMSDF